MLACTVQSSVISSPQHPYSLRPAEVEDIPQINRMLWDEYGPSYPYPIRTIDSDGIYVVAVSDQTGEIVGFSRATPHAGHARVYELAGLIVTRPHRQRDIAKHMTLVRLQECRQRDVKIAISEPVCYRLDCASQLNLLNFGFVLLGIQPAKFPDVQRDILQGQPESVLMAACWLQGESDFGTRRIFLPREYRGLPYTYLPREIHSRNFVRAMSGDLPKVVHHLGRRGTGMIGAEFLDIPANWPESADLIHEHVSRGFRFSCILPSFGDLEDGTQFDYVRLYRMSDMIHGFDFRRVHVAEQLAPLKYMVAGEHACRR